VRVLGGWSPYQFRERRMPTVAELNLAAPDTPVYVLFAYSAASSTARALRRSGSPPTASRRKGSFELVDGGAILRQPAAVYAAVAQLPGYSVEDQLNSTQHFFRELSRFGLTSALDAGATGTPYPRDYQAFETLAASRNFPSACQTCCSRSRVEPSARSLKS